jgi:hypothetical protein
LAIAGDVENRRCDAELAILFHAPRDIAKQAARKFDLFSALQTVHLNSRAFACVRTRAPTPRFPRQHPMPLQQCERSVNGTSMKGSVEFLGAAEDHGNVAALWSLLDDFHHGKALPRQSNPPGQQRSLNRD